MNEADGFLSRWARRKAQVQTGVAPPASSAEPTALAPPPVPLTEAAPGVVPGPEPAAAALPTLDDVAQLTRESDYSRFVAPGVDGSVRNAAMKKLFTDPHYNVMDGLDTYIDDYGKPDPIPESMLRMMRQSKFLGLFDDEEKPAAAPSSADGADGAAAAPDPLLTDPPTAPPPEHTDPEDRADEDTDLRLQQDDAAGRPGPDQGARA